MNKKKDRRKQMIIITVVLVLFSVATLITNRSSSKVETILKDTVATIEYYCIKAPINFVSNLYEEFTSLVDVYEENEILKEQLDTYVKTQATNEVLNEELEELKELLEIDYLPTEYNIKYATVISRDVENWSSQLKIDLGESSGVSENMAVVSAQGMIGIISDVSETSSTVTLLCNENSTSQLPVMILSGDDKYYGLLDYYDLETGAYRINLLSDVETIEDDATVVTSGLGGEGKCPKGILLGTVTQYSYQEDALESICYVTPSVDFDDLSYLAVVQKVNE